MLTNPSSFTLSYFHHSLILTKMNWAVLVTKGPYDIYTLREGKLYFYGNTVIYNTVLVPGIIQSDSVIISFS